ncbi:unnamed protein product [Caenorhabditis brenneri]
MLPMKTILLTVLFFATPISAQTQYKDFLKKPHVLPSAERAYHAIYHNLDTKAVKNTGVPMFGQLYVALIEDQFTFGGDLDEWENGLFQNGKRGCKPFMAANVHHLCDDKFFLVHQDMVKLQKTQVDNVKADLSNACAKGESGYKMEDDPTDHLVFRYGHRVLMAYKEDINHHKCFGTYDTRTDTFTCIRINKDTKSFEPIELPNFLWKETDGTFARGNGQVEVFCKQMHYQK